MRKETVAAFLWLLANLNVITAQSGNFLYSSCSETPIESRQFEYLNSSEWYCLAITLV